MERPGLLPSSFWSPSPGRGVWAVLAGEAGCSSLLDVRDVRMFKTRRTKARYSGRHTEERRRARVRTRSPLLGSRNRNLSKAKVSDSVAKQRAKSPYPGSVASLWQIEQWLDCRRQIYSLGPRLHGDDGFIRGQRQSQE